MIALIFLIPQNTSLVIHGASYLPTPDVASVCYVALINVMDGREISYI